MIPESLRLRLEESLARRFGPGTRITEIRSASGGCISRAAILRLSSGDSAFVKWLDHPPERFYEAEAEGLKALRSASPLRIPEVYAVSSAAESPRFLLMEDLTHGDVRSVRPATGSFDELLGQGLARQHRSTAKRFGFALDNYIGTTPQQNTWNANWPDFFRTNRLEPLLAMLAARQALGSADRRLFDRLLNRLDDLIATDEPPALLHGDLWSGNILQTADGCPALIDPAVYYGHRETDIAFTRLFGGLSPRALAAYQEAYPLAPGHEKRGELYNLYHLLNHALIFGGGYMAQARTVASRFV